MLDFQIMFFGWCRNIHSDKVWLIFRVEDKYYTGWGRRGKTLTFKFHSEFRAHHGDMPFDLEKARRKKIERGYASYAVDSLPAWAFKDVEDHVKYHLFNAKMTDRVR